MPRYIDADALLKDIEESVVFTVRTGQKSPEIRGANKIVDRIKSAPTVDMQEVKHGKWMRTFPNELLDGNYFCSNCQSGIDIATAEETPTDRELFYCPNCGAKMDGEESGG